LLRHDDALRLKRLCALKAAPELASHYCTGQQVTISSGPLKGISGIVSRTGRKHLLMVESGIYGIMLKIDMTRSVVE
jgi:transcription antitermination factor NusG